jgi:SAM-dependent methyltransferase
VTVSIVNPKNFETLNRNGEYLVDCSGNKFPIVDGVPRIAESDNYTKNFGVQWNRFSKTQLDRDEFGLSTSRERFFAETHWDREDLSGQDILEVGSGAGRFTRVVLEHTRGTLYSIDYSDAVTANFKNNGHIAPGRLHLFQASIYELPFPDNSFDKVFCFGVLQHTPDFDVSVKALIGKAKPGGEIAVDFYPIKGWWTKIHAKYLLRPLTKRIPHARLLTVIEWNIDWLIKAHWMMHRVGLGAMTRFLPVCNIRESFPSTLTASEIREWAILDTFDQYAPAHDHPQRVEDVVKMFERHGAEVRFAGVEAISNGMSATVVRGIKLRRD